MIDKITNNPQVMIIPEKGVVYDIFCPLCGKQVGGMGHTGADMDFSDIYESHVNPCPCPHLAFLYDVNSVMAEGEHLYFHYMSEKFIEKTKNALDLFISELKERLLTIDDGRKSINDSIMEEIINEHGKIELYQLCFTDHKDLLDFLTRTDYGSELLLIEDYTKNFVMVPDDHIIYGFDLSFIP